MNVRLSALVLAAAIMSWQPAAAQTTTPSPSGPSAVRPPSATSSQGTVQQQRRRSTEAARTTTSPAQRRTAPPPQTARGTPPAPGTLDLDLSASGNRRPVTSSPGTFSASGPYASDAQMQRYTGRRQIQMPQAPISPFGTQNQQGNHNTLSPSWSP